MANVKFYRGVRAKYDYVVDGGTASGKHVDGLYYATDTHEVLMNGVSYGNVADLRLQKATSGEGTQANPYVWANASSLYWGGHYRFATSDGVLAFEFDTPSVKSDSYLTFDGNGTNLDINSRKIADGDTSKTDHDKLATKGYVDDQIAGLSNAIVSVAGNGGASGAAGGTTVTLTKEQNSNTYSGTVYFTEKDGGSQPINIQFDAANFVKDSYLTDVTYYQTEPTGEGAPDGHAGVSYPALYFEFKTSGDVSNFWVSLNNLVDNYKGSDTIDITNNVIRAKVAANGGLTATSADGLTVNTAGYVTKSNNAVALDTRKIEGYASTEAATGDNNLASKKYVDSQLATGLKWNEVN